MKKLVAATAATTVVAGALAVPSHSATSVRVRDDVFTPKRVSVAKGTTVRWVWRGKSPHNVVVTKGPVKFKSAVKEKGTFSRRLTRRGTYTIVCTIHAPKMRMTLRVR